MCFSKPFAEYDEVLKMDEPLLVTGTVAREGEVEAMVVRLHMREAVPLQRLRAEKTRQMTVEVPADAVDANRLDNLAKLLERFSGSVKTVLRLNVPLRSSTDAELPAKWGVTPSDELLVHLEKLFGAGCVRLR